MFQELITYSFDAEEWTTDGQLIDFTQLAYPDCLSEIVYGDFAITDERDHAKCLHLSEVELGFLALNLAFHAENLQKGKFQTAFIASPHQNFELELVLEADKTCLVRLVDEPEKTVCIQIDELLKQAKNYCQNLWVDICNHFPALSSVEDYEAMEEAFML